MSTLQMTIQQKLLPLIENTDYTLSGEIISPVAKIRQVEQIIDHPAVPAVYSGETLISAQIPAHSETILVDETYYEILPSAEAFAEMLIDVKLESADISILVSEFLVGKEAQRDTENDTINIVDNRIHSWNFTNITQPTRAELVALVEISASKINQENINREAKQYLADTDYLIIREMDSGVICPVEIKQLRAEARAKIL